jgi:hypothetical protein
MLSYSQLGDRLNCSPEAARSLVKRLRLPRQKANDGKMLVSVDLSEINHKPMPARSPADDHPITATLQARIEALQAELIKLEATASGHRADFERERERADALMAELLKMTADAMAAKEAAARLRDGSGMRGSGYLFLPPVNGNSTVVPERHQVGCHRDLELVRLHLPAKKPGGAIKYI